MLSDPFGNGFCFVQFAALEAMAQLYQYDARPASEQVNDMAGSLSDAAATEHVVRRRVRRPDYGAGSGTAATGYHRRSAPASLRQASSDRPSMNTQNTSGKFLAARFPPSFSR